MYNLGVLVYIILLGIAGGQTDTSRCPANLVRDGSIQALGERCYQFVIHHHQNWPHANNDCRNKGGNLASIHNIQEQNFLMTHLAALNFRGNGVWIGLHDEGHQRVFAWTTGEQLDFSYWGVGQPKDDNGISLFGGIKEDCVLLKYSDSGHWHDYPCQALLLLPENYGWICEFKKTPPTAPTTASPNLHLESSDNSLKY